MLCPTPTTTRGFTLVELLVSISILTLLIGSSIAIINPPLIYAKARDTQRLADLSNLSASIDHYIIDNGKPPATINSMRLSDSLPLGQVGPLQNAKTGWIEGDMSKYTRKLFTDPTNVGDLVYRYKNDGVSFELDCQFEFLTQEQTKDGGNSAARYELGTDLTLM
ncbi:type II secretion system GspH family protein [Candidatus Parcubacteria bacterium]|nr:type II secretion system GspH family protein [Candidatus Parcubacteria bacterium]